MNESATVSGGPGSGHRPAGKPEHLLNCTAVSNAVLTSNGAPITLVANPSGVAGGSRARSKTNNATFDSGSGDITMTGTGGNSGLNDLGIQLTKRRCGRPAAATSP